MKEELKRFIDAKSFPCIMAKAVATKGLVKTLSLKDMEGSKAVETALKAFYSFVDEFRQNEERLSSFALVLDSDKYHHFDQFENAFWPFLTDMHKEDKKFYPHDPRVNSDPMDDEFSYSIKSEAFFILALHPESPRWARRFKYPALIFNPHQQFERLRTKGLFTKIRNIIRARDKSFQGNINPMLNDYGDRSEVFQYTGRVHDMNEPIPLYI